MARETIDLNVANAGELARISGMNEARANAIVRRRVERGPFRRWDDLADVEGVDRAFIEVLRAEATVAEEPGTTVQARNPAVYGGTLNALRTPRTPRGRVAGALLNAGRGALAGAAAIWVMDRITSYVYGSEGRRAFLREKRAQKRGLWAADKLTDNVAGLFGKRLSRRKAHRYGFFTHEFLGIFPGVLYAYARERTPWVSRGRGLLYGFGLFVLEDELANPLLGNTPGPRAYPWQAHARGLVGHLALGAVTDLVVGVLGGKRATAGQTA